MSIFNMIISGIALASDAFCVSVTKGLSTKEKAFKYAFIYSLFFGIFQGIMPFLGYLFGQQYEDKIKYIDHYIAFFLLVYIGIKMIYESFHKDICVHNDFSIKNLLILSLATSIDAASFGIAYACAYPNSNSNSIFFIIALITFILCFIGYIFGNVIGNKFNRSSNILGGVILILIGINILLKHLNLIP